MPLPGNCQHSVDSLVVNGSPSLMARLHMLQRLISHICKLGNVSYAAAMRLHCFHWSLAITNMQAVNTYVWFSFFYWLYFYTSIVFRRVLKYFTHHHWRSLSPLITVRTLRMTSTTRLASSASVASPRPSMLLGPTVVVRNHIFQPCGLTPQWVSQPSPCGLRVF